MLKKEMKCRIDVYYFAKCINRIPRYSNRAECLE